MRRGCYVKQYKKPEYHFVRNNGGLSGEKIAKLSEDELAEYLSRDSFKEQKKKYRIKSGYILREIAGEYAIVPVDGASVVVKGMQEYDVTEDVIRKSTEHFVEESLKYEILEEVK